MSAAPEFFIGWQKAPPPRLGRFLLRIGAGVLGGALVLALALGMAADEPAGPDFALLPGAAPPAVLGGDEGLLEGVLTMAPYPVLHLPGGRAVLLAEDGKRGTTVDPALEGRAVAAKGFALSRGSIDMLVLGGPPEPLAAPIAAPPVERLGRWRMTGEICDGKCAAGGMRPGTGLSHRACAALCLDGALPAVFVPTAPVAGSPTLLLGGPEGGPMPAALRGLVGLRVTLEGVVERRGGLLVLLADPATAVPR